MEFPDCTEETSNSKIIIADKNSKNSRSKVILENPKGNRVKLIQIDDCVITEGLRCDQLVILPDDSLIFIELKGNNVGYAIKQIEASLNYIKQQCSSARFREISCIISCTHCPLSSTAINNHKVKFKKNHKARLIVKSGQLTHKIE